MKTKVILIGMGEHGKVVAERMYINNKSNYEVIGFLDDENIDIWNGIVKLGNIDDIDKYIGNAKFHIVIGDNIFRKK